MSPGLAEDESRMDKFITHYTLVITHLNTTHYALWVLEIIGAPQ
jgi:hypothetical protein